MSTLEKKSACNRIREPNVAETQRTIVVLGAARGGTSMIAGTLRLLGVNMGENLNSSHENRQFRTALLGNRTPVDYLKMPWRFYRCYRPLLKKYNHEHAVWGIKDPTLTPYLPWLARYWRNPVYILVLRNPEAAATSQAVHFQQPFVQTFCSVLSTYQKLFGFALATQRPFLLINYEAALQNKHEMISALSDYSGIAVNAQQQQAAQAFIDQQKGYQWIMDENAQLMGFVEKISPQRISGWAFNPQTTESLTLALCQADATIALTQAEQPRHDVLENPGFGRLNCGFEFDVAAHTEKLNLADLYIIDIKTHLRLPRTNP